jgi:metallo-beta-lactamase family protein
LTLRADDATIVFSGDLGRKENPIMKEPAIIQSADYLIMESTYGNRLHPETPPEEDLGRIIRDTAKRGGTVLIPSFAVGRAQLVLYLIYKLKQAGAIPDLPVFLDSPMAQDATDIMHKHSSEHNLSREECAAVCKSATYVQSTDDSKALYNNKYPSIIISASGMAEGGRILHHIKHYGPDHHNTIAFAGFQAPMTRGEKMVSGAREVKIHGAMVPIRARVELLDSLSSHADYHGVLAWLRNFKKAPKCVFLTHGEPDALQSLKEKIEEEFDWRVSIPYYLEEVGL